MKRILLFISILFFFTFIISCNKKIDVETAKNELLKEVDEYYNDLSIDDFLDIEWEKVNRCFNDTRYFIKKLDEKNIGEGKSILYVLKNSIIGIQKYGYKSMELDGEEEFSVGDGSKENPFVIDSESKMCFFINMVNKEEINQVDILEREMKYYKLGANIDLSKIKQKKPYFCKCFYGNFDGNGYVLSGFTGESESKETTITIFLNNYGVIEKLGIVDVNITNIGNYSSEIAGIVGTNNNIIKNCYVIGEINIPENQDGRIVDGVSVGGICYKNKGIIENCYSSLLISANNEKLGKLNKFSGICIDNDSGVKGIINCLVAGGIIFKGDLEKKNCDFLPISNEYFNCYYFFMIQGILYSNVSNNAICSKNFYIDYLKWDLNIWNLKNIRYTGLNFLNDNYPKIVQSD